MAGHGETPKKIGRIDRSSYHEVGATEAIRTSFTVTLKRAHGDDEDTKVRKYEAVVSSAAGGGACLWPAGALAPAGLYSCSSSFLRFFVSST
jgi:hypothetical protein